MACEHHQCRDEQMNSVFATNYNINSNYPRRKFAENNTMVFVGFFWLYARVVCAIVWDTQKNITLLITAERVKAYVQRVFAVYTRIYSVHSTVYAE